MLPSLVLCPLAHSSPPLAVPLPLVVGESEITLTVGRLLVASLAKGLTLADDRPCERAPIKVVDGRP